MNKLKILGGIGLLSFIFGATITFIQIKPAILFMAIGLILILIMQILEKK